MLLSRGSPVTTAHPPSPSPAPESFVYKCNECDKTFGSYQALGGHKASHRKNNPAGAGAEVEQPAAATSGGRSHECSICHRCFPTGQALGGHKRRHYEGVIGGGRSGSGITSSEGGGSSNSQRGFDLNLPVMPEFVLGFADEEVESPHPAKKSRVFTTRL
ncbi:hypothetical protein L1987_30573 [Smallanthus sonchifolius]|uniref:Uncharacterized protein n=1 Tax=Smallanthus sonchifolius TaxID=185202 RepID=A0ACB9I4I5_9ASTR|nr:hypothetical protein L1987_30573 [Smallanthus sonchifolius]